MARLTAVLVGLVLFLTSCGVGRAQQVEQQREAVVALVDSVEWPSGYELGTRDMGDPLFGVGEARGGWVTERFVAEEANTSDIAADFDAALKSAGLALSATETHRCDGGEISAVYESRDPVTSTQLIYQDGRLRVTFGWDVRNLDVERPPLDRDVRLPECAG